VGSHAGDPVADPAVQLLREQQVGLLGVGVDLLRVVGRGADEVVHGHGRAQAAAAGRDAADDHHAAGGVLQLGEQVGDQRRMAEVVGAHLALVALGGAEQRPTHDAGVADEGVHGRGGGSEAGDAVQVGQVQGPDRQAGCGGAGPVDVAAREHDLGTGGPQFLGGREADPGGAARDDDRAVTPGGERCHLTPGGPWVTALGVLL
jgi:hypothetical protein